MPTGLGQDFRDINRVPSPLLARSLPWIVVMAASIAQTLPLIASAPVVPPLGFMVLLAWRQLHPGLLAVWAGLPLGLFDDLFSGQPMGSGMFLWSFAMIALDVMEQRFPWRSYVLDWAVAGGFIAGYLILAGVMGTSGHGLSVIATLAPQLMLSVLLFPLVERFVAICDRLRLRRFRAYP